MQWCRTYPYVSFFWRLHVEIYVYINIVVKNYRVLYFITQKRTQKISLVRKFCNSAAPVMVDCPGELDWNEFPSFVERLAIYFHDHPSTLNVKVKLHIFWVLPWCILTYDTSWKTRQFWLGVFTATMLGPPPQRSRAAVDPLHQRNSDLSGPVFFGAKQANDWRTICEPTWI